MGRRKLLLEEIRKEYNEKSRENSKKNIKKKKIWKISGLLTNLLMD